MKLTVRQVGSAGLLFYASAITAPEGTYAQEVNPATGQETIEVSSPQASLGTEITLSYGVTLTTNYISKGLTQTDDGPAVQPYLELGYGIGYVGLWASNASFDDVEDIELDVSVGIRPEFGDMSFDLGFVQYFYRDDPEDYGELYLFGEYAPSEEWSAKFQYYREVYADKDWLYLGASYSGLPWDWTLSGGVGSDFGSGDFSESSIAADIGVTGQISENASYDFRVHDSSIEGSRFIASISFFN
ncbi:TorF family putative porin [Paracoccus actinidiae]|uniref:TorF family putative porin n=1 Tax=Paracoccus actinidiae TaxID=3064531 RepID=UPI0027D22876|nr:TorF family putative porin [Paracoccus sp. M09]